MLKRENGGQMASSPLHGGAAAAGDAGKELLRHLLKDKASAAAQATLSCRQLSNDSLRSEEEEGPAVPGAHNSMVGRTLDVVFGLWSLDKMLYWYASSSDSLVGLYYTLSASLSYPSKCIFTRVQSQDRHLVCIQP